MDFLTAASITHPNGETTHYYEGGSKDGTPLIFIHGWPDIAQSWHHQLKHFSSSKYRVLAPDMRGYGGSSAPKDKRAYSLEVLTNELVDFAHQLGIQKAIWVGHDWGCGVVNALAAHHPELFLGLAVLAVPYRSLELGLDFMVAHVNRDIYPKEEYPYGQFEYQVKYERDPEDSIRGLSDADQSKLVKLLHTPHNPAHYGKPAFTSRSLRDGSMGAQLASAPDIPLEYTFLDESLYKALLESHKKHGWFPPTAYYLNHDVNAEFAKSEVNGGVLEFPVLYIDAKHDAICSTTTLPLAAETQKRAAKLLSYELIESGHWVHLEKPKETNEALEKWLGAIQIQK
ncbi:alpha/beta-hydrolase [Bimuria novae-zelandiae CBS 107.79]|uniref:Alpha/beta-hydrolase n=1 Tax=Bimuria novae-zelandiae CBS 107.79 TaxID=1447943 RepID=A0A6A5UZH3_9PLEO|nr:alpha/beta-hydrolase [Bimuria novae-zelandiae CBS 107.79]